MTIRKPVTLCGAKGRQGTPCRRPAGWGTDHAGFGTCKFHTGSTRTQAKHAEKLERTLREQLADEIDPSLSVVRRMRDGEDVSPRDRIKAATWLVERAIELTEGTGGVELKITLKGWPDFYG
jgi:hypothetical protein